MDVFLVDAGMVPVLFLFKDEVLLDCSACGGIAHLGRDRGVEGEAVPVQPHGGLGGLHV